MKKAAAVLLIVGLLQMSGDLLGSPALKGIGAATGCSPAPKVFTVVRGMEAYSTQFHLEWTDRRGVTHERQLTPEIYARVSGPYNRRNVYGAVLAAGPVLATDERLAPMFHSVSSFALCGDALLVGELGIEPAEVVRVRVRYEPAPGKSMGDLPRAQEGEAFRAAVPEHRRAALPDSLIVMREDGDLLSRSAAVLHLLRRLGGVWRVTGMLAGCLPSAWLDRGYDCLARVRRQLFPAPSSACPLIPAQLRERFEH